MQDVRVPTFILSDFQIKSASLIQQYKLRFSIVHSTHRLSY